MNFVRTIFRRLSGSKDSYPASINVGKVDFGDASFDNDFDLNSSSHSEVNLESIGKTSMLEKSAIVEEVVDFESSVGCISSKSTFSPTDDCEVNSEVNSAVAIVSDDGNRSSERLETIPTSINTTSPVRPDFFGRGIMDRPNWVPKSQNGIKKLKYIGLNNYGYHMFKVWYCDLLEFEWEYRDYEELVEDYPHLLPRCREEIRKGCMPETRPVVSDGSARKGKGIESKIYICESGDQMGSEIPFQSKNAKCVQFAFLNLMGMDEGVRVYMQQHIPDDFTNFSVLGTFLNKEGISLMKIHPDDADKASWMLKRAAPGKYLVSGDGHVIGVIVSGNNDAIIFDAAESHSKMLTKRSFEESVGTNVQDIRMVHDRRSKKAKRHNLLNLQCEQVKKETRFFCE